MMRAGVSITPSVVQQYRLNRAKRWNCVPNQRGLVKWTKYDDAEEEEIRASKCMVLKYSDAEYALLCQVPEWTRKETDLLIELCEEYQVRFFVIWDRWVSRIEQGNNKTIEDLKDRYYKVQKALIRYKCGEGVESVASQQRHEENGMDKENDFELDIDDRHGESDLQLNASLSSISIDNPLFSVEYDVNADKRRKEELKKVFERDENDVVKAMHLVLQNRDIDKKLRAMSSDEKRKQQIYELFHTLVIVASSMFSDAEDEANSPRRGGSPSPMKRARWRKNKVDLFGGDPSQLSELLSGIPSEAVHRNIFKPKAKGTYLRSTWPQDLPNVSLFEMKINYLIVMLGIS
jgi:DNA methyltransferase 1-associated protein 1